MMIVNSKGLIFLFVFVVLTMFPVLANHSVELCTRLSIINSFHVRFIQKITDSTGVLLQENTGELWIQHPNFFNYHVIFPEESFLISNGEVLWFYEPSLNQVIIRRLKDVFDSSLLKLLLTNGAKCLNWYEYHVDRTEDTFYLFPKDDNSAILKKIEIKINVQGIIKELSVFYRENQCIHYLLTQYDIRLFNVNKFNFCPPDGVTVDEQR